MTTMHEEGTYTPVKVHVASVEAGVQIGSAAPSKPFNRGRYETFVLNANDPVQCILPEDPDRIEAWVLVVDNDIVIGTQNQVQANLNTVTGTPHPQGTYLLVANTGGGVYAWPVRDNQAVFAGITTTASNSRVSVAAYYRD